MCLRRILFGYRVENDEYVIVQTEACIVKRAFDLYINGMTLKSVADTFTSEGIQYSDDKFVWNKNMIFRILENSHYVGDDEYPQIVSREIFEAAMLRKNRLGGKREKDSAEIKYLKSVLCCSACGSRIRRISNYTRREKWVCENNCKIKEFFDDKLLYKKIVALVKRVIANPQMLDVQPRDIKYEPNADMLRKTNELRYIFDQNNIQFSFVKKAILDCVQSKFDSCIFDASVYTEQLKKYLSEHEVNNGLNIEVLSNVVEKIYINANGSIMIRFINGKEINSE